MTHNPDADNTCEAVKIAAIVVPYVQGGCLDIGSGYGKMWPSMIGIDPGIKEGVPITDMALDGTKLTYLADASFQGVFSSHLLQHIPRDEVPVVLADWARVLKPGGFLTLYVPSANLRPDIGEDKWAIRPGDIEAILKADLSGKPHGWELILSEERDQDDEYSILIVLRKTTDASHWRENLWERNPAGKQRALVIRYGAIGDSIVCASVFPLLQARGYHVTVNTQPRIKDVLLHDPHIDEWWIQETDFVPNHMLGPYWERISTRFNRVVNLSESVEVNLLTTPGKLTHAYSAGARRRIYDKINYLEHTHDIADVPYDFSGSRFYPTAAETEWAERKKSRLGHNAPVIVWVVNGSSVHKVYPFVDVVLAWLIERTPAHVVLYGDPKKGKELADGILTNLTENGINHSRRVTNIAGVWSLRESLSFAIQADLVIGPETGPLNSVAMEDVPKIIYLSHSSHENLTKHWRNTVVMTPGRVAVPCYPCHQMHYGWDHCHRVEETGAALCASSFKPESVFREIARCLGAVKVS